MKKGIMKGVAFSCLLGLPCAVLPQQSPVYSHYLFNQMAINTGYAGTQGSYSAFFLLRNQWTGLRGAPRTFGVSLQGPVAGRKVGLGLHLFEDQIGPLVSQSVAGVYSYVNRFGNSVLGVGIQGGLEIQGVNWKTLDAALEGDAAFPMSGDKATVPNIGVGIFFHNDRMAIGASAPRLFENEIKFSQYETGLSGQKNHYYLFGAWLSRLSENVKLKNSGLLKAVGGSRLNFDYNAHFIMYDRLWLGAGIRSEGTGIFSVSYNRHQMIGKRKWNFQAGYAYEYPNKKIRKIAQEGHEIFFGMDLSANKEKYLSPRYF